MFIPPSGRNPLVYLEHRVGDHYGVRTVRARVIMLDPLLPELLAITETVQTTLRQMDAQEVEHPGVMAIARGNLPPLTAVTLTFRPAQDCSEQVINERMAALTAGLKPRYSGIASITPRVEFGLMKLTCHARVTLTHGSFTLPPQRGSNSAQRSLKLTAQPDNSFELRFQLRNSAVIGLESLDVEYERAADALGVCLDHLAFDSEIRQGVRQLVSAN